MNNPYGIKYLSEYGRVNTFVAERGGTDSGIPADDGGTFARFPSTEAADRVVIDLFRESRIYGDLRTGEALRTWSHNGYGGEKLAGTGIDPQTYVRDLSDDQILSLLNVIRGAENVGGAGGTRSRTLVTLMATLTHRASCRDLGAVFCKIAGTR